MDVVIKNRTRHATVVVEDVYQQHNANAILRSCEIFGVQDVHIIELRNKFKSVSSVAMGSAKWLDIYRYKSSADCAQALKNSGYRLIALIPHTQAKPIHAVDLEQKAAFIFGTEETGISPELLAYADEYAIIPMYGFTQSFNVSVSVALCLSDVITRLHNSPIDWRLTEGQQADVMLSWLRKHIPGCQEIEKRIMDDQAI